MKTARLAAAMAAEHIRDLAYSAWSLLMPPLGYGIAAIFLDNGSPERAGMILGGAILISAALMGCISFPLGLRSLEDSGVGRRIRICPMPRPAFLLAGGVAEATIAVASCLLLLGVGLALGAPVARAPGLWALGAALSIGVCMALGAALHASGAAFLATKNYGNLLLLAVVLTSGLFFRLPGPAATVHEIFPTWHLLRLFGRAAGALNDVHASTYLVPAIWIAALLAVAAVGGRRGGTDA